MHHAIDELIKNAGFSSKRDTSHVDSLFTAKGQSPGNTGSPTENASNDIDQIVPLSQSTPQTGNNEPTNETGSTQTSNSGGLASSLDGAASDLLGGGGVLQGLLGGGLLGDLFSGITDLFGGGSSQAPPPVQYQAPQSQDFELATGNGQVGDAVYNQFGAPQVAPSAEPALSGLQYLGSSSSQSSDTGASGGSSETQSSPQITLNVQAMDSQSFLDRSGDIAQAVRQAMLNMHSINDVINDL